MNDLLEAAEHPVADCETLRTNEKPDDASSAVCPPGLPEKFWDPERNEVRMNALAKSYVELEQRLGAGTNVPDGPDDYKFEAPGELFTPDPKVNAALHAAGFTNEQAQVVYNLASERLMPMATQIAAQFEAQSQIDQLTSEFGGEQKWLETARQIRGWGEKNLPSEVFSALSTSVEGVKTLHQMMRNGEPELARNGGPFNGVMSEGSIREMMKDPRYWRDQDPAYVNKVQDAFKRLYPNEE